MEFKGRRISPRRKEALLAYSIIGPIYIWFAIVIIIPILLGIFISFTEWNGLTSRPHWIGIANYKTFFTSPDYLISLWKQLWIGGVGFAANTLIAFILALMLNVPMKLRGLFRSTFYVPNVASVATTTAVIIALLNPQSGPLNKFLQSLGLNPVIWSYSPFWMVFWITAYGVWRGVGPTAIIWLAGLQSIDPTLYEAGKIDGANRFQLIRYVTLPGLRPIASYIVITGLIGSMQMWDSVMFISRGGPVGATDVLMYRIYRDGLESFNMGMSGASSMVLGFVTMILTVIYIQFIVRRQEIL
ncbi:MULTISPECIES: sugar ABC transporter permease [unclassified Paenibacillus]|uniref:carbohydrate ABC transporter permease n=1 Tax=unclassified Paenibacillus TaxID=185978 RepID=UPI0006932E69|nr:sugar ABC transporter permease [Paenibacillus sp. FSL R5-0912]